MTDTPKLYQAIHAQPAAIRALLSDWDSTTQAAQQVEGKDVFFCQALAPAITQRS